MIEKLRPFFGIFFIALWVWLCIWPSPTLAPKELSRTVQFENGRVARAYLTTGQKWRFPVETQKLPDWLLPSLYCIEDKRFESHFGVDPVAALRALTQNAKAGKVVSGASTLTMQVARLSAPQSRTLTAKLSEALRALQIETRLSKNEILERYLNEAPFGGNIEGLETASYRFFQKSAVWLNPSEFAFLMTLPQSPPRWHQLSKPQLQIVRDQKLQKMHKCGILTASQLSQWTQTKIPEVRGGFQAYAEHWTDDLTKEYPNQKTIHSTLNFEMQKSFEELLQKKRDLWSESFVQNAAVFAIENSTGKVLAAVGNFDYFDTVAGQKFAGYKTFRSTGSVLKPFFYASLLSSGEILPETMLEDVPGDFNGYAPKNYDGKFQGLVESQYALAHSLNLPWIKILSETGVDSLLNFLRAGGITLNLKDQDIGLSMIIGGVQASLMDLTRMYTAFPNGGKILTLKKISTEKTSAPFRWFHPGAAELTSRALNIRGRPDYAIDPLQFKNDLSLRWKTGTSQGRKDAWAIGYNNSITIGVWLGNMDNEPSPKLVGSEIAAPFLFELFASQKNNQAEFKTPPFSPILQKIEVCSFSGQTPGPDCTSRKQVDAPYGIVPRHRCAYHHQLLVDTKSNLRIHQDCQVKGARPALRSYVTLPSDVQMWLNDAGPNVQLQPPFHPKCRWMNKEKGNLEIVEPRGDVFLLTGKNEMLLPLKIRSPDKSEFPNCFLNGRKLLLNKDDFQPLLRLKAGDYDLMCSDKVGRSDQVEFRVER